MLSGVLGQNGMDKMVLDKVELFKMVWTKWCMDKMVLFKMVRTKWYTDKMVLYKVVWTKWYGHNGTDTNGMDKMVQIKMARIK